MNREELIAELSESIIEEFRGNSSKIKIKTDAKSENNLLSKKSLALLRKEFGRNKEIPKEFEPHILYALSFYPELRNAKISFQVKKAFFLMETRATPSFLFSKKRHYVVNIQKKYAGSLHKYFSVIGLAGLIGHELGHVADYERKSRFEMIKFAARYAFPSSRRKIELANDLREFYHGMGYAMIVYGKEYMKSPFSGSVKKYHDSFYLRGEELKKLGRTKAENQTKSDHLVK